MACQVLNRFGIYRRMNKVGDVSMPQLMGCYLKVQAVNHFSVMSGLFSQDRCDSMLYSFSIFIPIIAPFLDRSRNNILPQPLKLRIGQRFAIPIWNNILRSGIYLCFSQAVCQADGERNVSLRCLCFQFIRNHRSVMFGVPCPPYRQIWSIRIQIY